MSFIKEYRNAIPPDLCENIIKKLEEENVMQSGKVNNGKLNDATKKTYDFCLGYNHNHDKIDAKYWETTNKTIESFIGEYLNKYIYEYIGPEIFRTDDKERLISYLGYNFYPGLLTTKYIYQKYTPGCYFRPHTDDIIGEQKRVIAIIIYLNDVDPKNGGSTRFYNGREVQPETGKILFFPSTWNYLHQGSEIKNGVKYIISSFACSIEYENFLKRKCT